MASERLDSIARNLDGILQDSRPLPKQLNNSLNRVDAILIDLQRSSKSIGDRSESIAQSRREPDQVQPGIDEVNALFRVIDQNDSTLRRIIADPSLYNHLDEAACMLRA